MTLDFATPGETSLHQQATDLALGVRPLDYAAGRPLGQHGRPAGCHHRRRLVKTALALLAERWDRDMPRSAKLVLLVYDEIDAECDLADVEQVLDVLLDVMQVGMAPQLERMPVQVDSKVGADWAGSLLEDAGDE
jgi:hypothetical protein